MTTSITQTLAKEITAYTFDALPEAAKTFAKHCILDWFAVTIAGAQEPLAQMLVRELAADGGTNTLIGHRWRANLIDSALINGATSHALDYDDTVMSMMGHASVAIFPAVLSLAERLNSSGQEIITAFVAGFDTACRIGLLAQPSHYGIGFHNTGTIGTFGAAAAAGRLMNLSPLPMAHALGLAAAQAAGLKSSFGTMAKPLQAGKAAANGLLSARLAAQGFTANTQALETSQGFLATQSRESDPVLKPVAPGALIQENLFKYHAACYFTHSPIEALATLCVRHDLSPDMIERVTLHVPAGHLSVCNIQDPQTGLEAKFSLRQCAAFVLHKLNTASLATFSDENATNQEMARTRARIDVIGDHPGSTAARVDVLIKGGDLFSESHDTGIPETNLDLQESRLTIKAKALLTPAIGRDSSNQIVHDSLSLEEDGKFDDLLSLLSP